MNRARPVWLSLAGLVALGPLPIAYVAMSQGLEPHGPVDPTPRCVTNAERRTRACHCDALNRTPLPDAARFVLHRGRCVVEGGLGPPLTRQPRPVPPR